MNESLTQKIRNDFDRIALHNQEGWDHNNHYHRFLFKQLPTQGKTALDIGCGTGEFSRLLAKRFESVVAIDLFPNMIEIAKQRSRQFSKSYSFASTTNLHKLIGEGKSQKTSALALFSGLGEASDGITSLQMQGLQEAYGWKLWAIAAQYSS